MKRQATHFNTHLGGEARETQQVLGVTAKLARQIDHRTGAAEGDPQQQLRVLGITRKLPHLVRIVSDEGTYTVIHGVTDVLIPLDGMCMNTALRIRTQTMNEVHLTRCRQIEKT